MYSEKIMNEFYNAQNYDVIRGASGVGKITCDVGNEIIKIYIKVENDKITEATFQTFGGVVAVAASSVAVNSLKDMTISQARKFDANRIYEVLGDIPEHKAYIIPLVTRAVLAAVEDSLA